MPFRDNKTHLRDILGGIERIEAFVAGMDLDAYRIDELRKSATERQLQIITEAAKRLGDDAYAYVLTRTRRVSVVWGTFSVMVTTKLRMKSSGTQ